MLRRTPQKEAEKAQRKDVGQSTVEYIILFAAVIAVMLIFLRPGGYFQNTLNQTLNTGANSMLNMAIRLRDSAPLAQ